jgi:hypothetical protein
MFTGPRAHSNRIGGPRPQALPLRSAIETPVSEADFASVEVPDGR